MAVEVRSSATHCELLVADSGPGVRSEWLSRIFDPFVQADGSPTINAGKPGEATSGLDFDSDQIIELAALRVRIQSVVETEDDA